MNLLIGKKNYISNQEDLEYRYMYILLFDDDSTHLVKRFENKFLAFEEVLFIGKRRCRQTLNISFLPWSAETGDGLYQSSNSKGCE